MRFLDKTFERFFAYFFFFELAFADNQYIAAVFADKIDFYLF